MPGAPAVDAPLLAGERSWLIDRLGGEFTGLYFAGSEPLPAAAASALKSLALLPVPVKPLIVTSKGSRLAAEADNCAEDVESLLQRRLDATPGAFYLFRPDQHLAARWRHLDAYAVRAALARATSNVALAEADATV
jgi:3-(3-hydroxy-phenyl)propionate hydroxylase